MKPKKNQLMIVGSNPNNQRLLAEFITKLGYDVVRADSLEEVDRLICQETEPDFALLDISGFDQLVWERCSSINSRNIPLLVISPRQSAEVTKLSLAHGAQSVLAKPLVMRELADVIHGFMQAPLKK